MSVDLNLLRLRVSVQNALIGRITSNVVSIYIGLKNKKISLLVVIDCEISEYWVETISEIGGEVLADFDDDYDIDENLSSKSDSLKLLNCADMIIVYQRHE